MRKSVLPIAALAALLASCGGENKPSSTPAATEAPAPKPADESRRFPKENLVDTKVVDRHLLDKSFMPGGTLATYKKGRVEYQMFAAKLATPLDAAIILPDWKNALKDAKVQAAFGGYSGDDRGRPVFVFAKGNWIAGVAGLPEKQADQQARILASYLN